MQYDDACSMSIDFEALEAELFKDVHRRRDERVKG